MPAVLANYTRASRARPAIRFAPGVDSPDACYKRWTFSPGQESGMARHTDDHATRRRRRRALVIAAAWMVALSGCHAATQLQSDATPSSGPTATAKPAFDTPALDKHPVGSRRFRDCSAAARDEPARRRCLDEELAYQQRTLDHLADERAVALDAAARRNFQAAQRAWQQETDRACGTGADASVLDDAAARCRIDRISARFDSLSFDSMSPDASAPGAWVKVTPDASGAADARVRDATLSLQSDGCSDERGRVVCRNARLRIATSMMREQSLTLPMLVFTPAGQPGGTLYRGRLDKGFADGWHSVVLTDIDADGDEDLLVWTGFDGNYGDPSYRYALYDAGSGRLEESAALAALVQGHSIARIVDGQVFVWSRSGPCQRGEKTIDLRGPAPKVAASRNYDTCRQDAP